MTEPDVTNPNGSGKKSAAFSIGQSSRKKVRKVVPTATRTDSAPRAALSAATASAGSSTTSPSVTNLVGEGARYEAPAGRQQQTHERDSPSAAPKQHELSASQHAKHAVTGNPATQPSVTTLFGAGKDYGAPTSNSSAGTTAERLKPFNTPGGSNSTTQYEPERPLQQVLEAVRRLPSELSSPTFNSEKRDEAASKTGSNFPVTVERIGSVAPPTDKTQALRRQIDKAAAAIQHHAQLLGRLVNELAHTSHPEAVVVIRDLSAPARTSVRAAVLRSMYQADNEIEPKSIGIWRQAKSSRVFNLFYDDDCLADLFDCRCSTNFEATVDPAPQRPLTKPAGDA